MSTVDELKSKAAAEIERRGEYLIGIARTILNRPEPGFREFETARAVGEAFAGLGIAYRDRIGITGLRGDLHGGARGPTVAVMGELDSLKVLGHPHADPETSAAHACGHHCQIGMMLGAAVGLLAEGVLDALSGRVALMAVPAEEYIEVEYRDDLRRAGKLEFIGGKPEFIRLGELDDVDVAMMTHTSSVDSDSGMIAFGGSNNGMVAKRIRFLGRAAHAGGAPHMGINALNAAMIAMSAIHAQRETYQDPHTIRVHPIITQGGVAVSSVPADVRMETYVRGARADAFLDASEKVDRALRAGAMAVGGSVEITTLPGYLPIRSDESMLSLYAENAASLVGRSNLRRLSHRTGSTDMGDVSQLMPVIHPYVNAATGSGHGIDYVVQDYELGVLTGAKAMAMTVIDLLANGGEQARRIAGEYRPPLSKDSYLDLMRSMLSERTYQK